MSGFVYIYSLEKYTYVYSYVPSIHMYKEEEREHALHIRVFSH